MGQLTHEWEIILDGYLEDFLKKHFSLVFKKTGISIELQNQMFKQLKTLTPKPGNGFGQNLNGNYIIPDVEIKMEDDQAKVSLCFDNEKSFVIRQDYVDMLDNNDEAAKYILEKYRQACFVKSCMEKRKNSLLYIAQKIAERQREFFQSGQPKFKRLTVTELAETLEVHPSTVSRIMAIHIASSGNTPETDAT